MRVIIRNHNIQAALLEPKDWKLWRDLQIDTLLQLENDPQTARDFGEFPDRYWRSILEYKEHHCIVILQDGTAAGYATLDTTDGTAMIEAIDILPVHQGKGLGSIAYAACITHMAEQNYPYVEVDILPDNTRSIKAAMKNGFKIAAANVQEAVLSKTHMRYICDLHPPSNGLDLFAPE